MQRRRGVSLAKGPIAIIGLIGIIYGASALIVRAHGFTIHFPSGHVYGPFWLHLEVNGWTALLFIAAGLALLFSAAAHVTAKTMALLVGIVMIVLAVIGFFQKHGTLGIFASNHWTELVWAAGGVVLLVLAMLPRVGGGPVRTAPVPAGTAAGPAPTGRTTAPARTGAAAAPAGTGRAAAPGRDPAAEERLARREPAASSEPAASDRAAAPPAASPPAASQPSASEPTASERPVAEGDEQLVRHTQPVSEAEEQE